MDWWWIVLIVVAALVILGMLAALRTRSASMKRRFGPEYDRVLDEEGDRRSAEARLRERTKRREALEIRELPPDAAARYVDQWSEVQLRFVDDPGGSLADAEVLVQAVARVRGYPVDHDEEGIEMLSVDYPRLVGPYRDARGIHQHSADDSVAIDHQREAFRHYRSLFVELVGDRSARERAVSRGQVEGE